MQYIEIFVRFSLKTIYIWQHSPEDWHALIKLSYLELKEPIGHLISVILIDNCKWFVSTRRTSYNILVKLLILTLIGIFIIIGIILSFFLKYLDNIDILD
jgi:hypothetical protein